MKILIITDPHGNLNKIKQIPKKGIDLILVNGDIGESVLLRKIFFTRVDSEVKKEFPKQMIIKAFSERLNSTLELFKYLTKIAPTYTIWGNVDISDKRAREYWKIFNVKTPLLRGNIKKIKELKIIENKLVKINGLKIGGIGFFVEYLWIKTFKPSNYERKLKKAEKKTEKIRKILNKFGKVDILLIHQPPYGILDKVSAKFAPRSWQGKHAGSKLLLDYIKKQQPKYVFCGHIHEGKGQKKIGQTKVYNLGLCGWKIIEV